MSRFIPVDRQTDYLLPPSVDEWLPDEHLARFVVDVVEQLDLSALTQQYAGRGHKAHHPAVLLSLLIYGYATGVISSRKIERATYDSIAFRYLAANTHPDHDTLATFRRRFLPELEQLFVQVLLLAREMKLLKFGTIALDGTKVKANASKHKALSYGHAKKLEAQLKTEVNALIQRAEAADNDVATDGMDIPAEIARREARLAAIAEAKLKIEARAQERDAAEQTAYQDKTANRDAQRKAGKKPRGRDPKPPMGGPRDKDQVNLTDPQSRIMPVTGKGFDQCYNAQAAVDTESMLVTSVHVTQATNDKQQVMPLLNALTALPASLGKVTHLLADTGYFSAENVKVCAQQGIEPLIAMKRDVHHLPLLERFAAEPVAPDSDDPVEQMAYRLKTQAGRVRYALRKHTVEPVFGIIKHVMGFRQFSLRGLDKVSGEWRLATLAWNIKRMHRLAAG
ncbi:MULTISPECIES: IS1182 family transposase [Enterobacteriaceae]|jgi:transposase|uniref:IS1182 family transposase n=1 Tax=Enterobacterales TaxID=91347 RepID=UPI000EFA0648|nr:IS1182 family transposase [Enterobacter hormaechei]EKV4491040.1 IS1182 family transposase [Citrobacter freundii]EKW1859633.1 IS1182 family transposase [Klebsiella pneumoniae]ELP3839969.1 IS1182 family transposase [Escherichia coli]EKZ5314619.1 IS1182 family transposase [Klebsiella pneumoniae]EKZ6227875.1 IS1182 family transposase [Klebsiella pneumoniae]